jgi:hypothetical protein
LRIPQPPRFIFSALRVFASFASCLPLACIKNVTHAQVYRTAAQMPTLRHRRADYYTNLRNTRAATGGISDALVAIDVQR